MRLRGARLREERGVALVEFALVAPLLMLLLFGMLDFGKAFNYWIDETHLANTGARYAVVNKDFSGEPPLIESDGTTRPCNTLQAYLVCQADTRELRASAAVCVRFPQPNNPSAENPDPKRGDPVKVVVSMKYNWLDFIQNKLGFGATLVKGSSTMRLEQDPTTYTANPDDCP